MGCVDSSRKITVKTCTEKEGGGLISQVSIKKNEIIKPINREVSLKVNSSLFINEINANPFHIYKTIKKLGEGGYGKVF